MPTRIANQPTPIVRRPAAPPTTTPEVAPRATTGLRPVAAAEIAALARSGGIRSVEVFSGRRSVDLGATPIILKTDEMLDPTSAHFALPVSALGKPGESAADVIGRIDSLTAAEPWGDGEPATLTASADGQSIEVAVGLDASAAWRDAKPQLSLQWRSGTKEVVDVASATLGVDDSVHRQAGLAGNLETKEWARDRTRGFLDRYTAERADPSLIEASINDERIGGIEADIAKLQGQVTERTTTADAAWEGAALRTKLEINVHTVRHHRVPHEIEDTLQQLSVRALSADVAAENVRNPEIRARKVVERDDALAKLEALITEHGLHEVRLGVGEAKLGITGHDKSLSGLRGELEFTRSHLDGVRSRLADKRARHAARLPEMIEKLEGELAGAEREVAEIKRDLASLEPKLMLVPTRYRRD